MRCKRGLTEECAVNGGPGSRGQRCASIQPRAAEVHQTMAAAVARGAALCMQPRTHVDNHSMLGAKVGGQGAPDSCCTGRRTRRTSRRCRRRSHGTHPCQPSQRCQHLMIHTQVDAKRGARQARQQRLRRTLVAKHHRCRRRDVLITHGLHQRTSTLSSRTSQQLTRDAPNPCGRCRRQ